LIAHLSRLSARHPNGLTVKSKQKRPKLKRTGGENSDGALKSSFGIGKASGKRRANARLGHRCHSVVGQQINSARVRERDYHAHALSSSSHRTTKNVSVLEEGIVGVDHHVPGVQVRVAFIASCSWLETGWHESGIDKATERERERANHTQQQTLPVDRNRITSGTGTCPADLRREATSR
jgi:hypothetical protein